MSIQLHDCQCHSSRTIAGKFYDLDLEFVCFLTSIYTFFKVLFFESENLKTLNDSTHNVTCNFSSCLHVRVKSRLQICNCGQLSVHAISLLRFSCASISIPAKQNYTFSQTPKTSNFLGFVENSCVESGVFFTEMVCGIVWALNSRRVRLDFPIKKSIRPHFRTYH